MSGTLFVVATPLGHLGDLSSRAADVLRTVAVVAAEDTRHTRKLLSHLDAHPTLISAHEHSPAARVAALIERLVGGEDVALVTDAGTPVVSDPGAGLVAAAHAAGVPVVPIPGPSAVATALSASGLPGDQYLFLGFAPRKGAERTAWMAAARESTRTVVMFEAANRLVALLTELGQGDDSARSTVVCRELTKVHEEVRLGTLAELAAYYEEHAPRGEVTVVLAGAGKMEQGQEGQEIRAREIAHRLLAAGLSKRDAASALHEAFGIARNEAYRIVNET